MSRYELEVEVPLSPQTPSGSGRTRVVLVHRRIAENRAPKAEVDRLRPGGDRHLDLLDQPSISGGPVLARHGRTFPTV